MKFLLNCLPWRVLLLNLLLGFSFCVDAKSDIEAQRAKIDTMAEQTLAEFYAADPANKELITNAAGYGVFSNAHVSVVLASLGGGNGVVYYNQGQHKVYMKMAELGLGLGAGVKDQRFIIVFSNPDTMESFCDKGWFFGGRADATAQTLEKGGSFDIETASHGIRIFQFSKRGLVLEATVKGNKFWRDEDLN
ncbi:YSC84-related protein [Agaribacterium haliotis]|uniref:lipid-binding SYLF domain-containing protein n=1 Tax=Agaribacterium haliotis TaxID=2013869 RepID=UPI000BB5879E|nr:YSC84-related protein [Agaribacterium haliotis]